MEADELRVAKIADDLHHDISKQLQAHRDSQKVDVTILLYSINQFQPCPQLLDKHLKAYIEELLKIYIEQDLKWSAEAFYTIGKVVTSKKMLNYMKTDIDLIPVVASRLSDVTSIHWHEQYLLLCWLTVLCIAPFKLETLQKNSEQYIYDIGLAFAKKSGPLQPLGSRVLASLIMRNDCEKQLNTFVNLITTDYHSSSFVEKHGYLQTLNLALQKDSNLLFRPILRELVTFIKSCESDEASIALVAKIYPKVVKYLIEDDDYETIEDVITFFLDNFSNRNTDTRFLLAKKFVKLANSLDSCFGIEIMIDIIHTGRELLQESSETVNADKLHTYLLTIAEFLRLSLIDHTGYRHIEEILSKTLFFQQSRITFVAGSNIRDASNFICWSLFKYNKDVPLSIAESIFKKLLLVSCFDKDIMIRRSSTAALQELIGRYGNSIWEEFFPNEENTSKNIKTIQILDYVDLGSSHKSFYEIPQKLLKLFPSLRVSFVNYLASNVSNIDTEVVKQSAKSLYLLIQDCEPTLIDQHIEINIGMYKHRFNSFYYLSHIIPLSHNKEQHINQLTPDFREVKVNHHKDPSFVLLSYISLLNELLELKYKPTEDDFTNIFDIIRVENEDIKEVLVKMAPKLSLDTESWNKWLYYMRNNNKNTASSVALLPDFPSRINDVLSLLTNGKLEAETRASIIYSMSGYLQRSQLRYDVLITLCGQLDDYTISEQGDVGNRIRAATLRLIDANIEVFQSPAIAKHTEYRLLRISCEPIDKTRNESFNLLHKFHREKMPDFISLDAYFDHLLDFHSKHYLSDKKVSTEFWRGYIFSCGALKATDSLIVSSLTSFLKFYANLTSALQKEVLLQLAAVIKAEPEKLKGNSSHAQRANKTILVGLQFWSRILEANISIPESFPLKGLYVRVYNLHLNTKNIIRLSASIKVFGYLALMSLEDPLKRLCWLTTKHPIARVRVLASEELFSFYNEKLITLMDDNAKQELTRLLDILKEVDWNKPDNKITEKNIFYTLV